MKNNHKLYLMPLIDLPAFKLGITDDDRGNLERIKNLYREYDQKFDFAESYIITAVNDKQIRRFERMLKEDFEDFRYEMPKDKNGYTEFFQIEVLPRILKYIELKKDVAGHLGLSIEKGIKLQTLAKQYQSNKSIQPKKARQKPFSPKKKIEEDIVVEKSFRDTCIYETLELIMKNKDNLIYFEEEIEDEDNQRSFLEEKTERGTRGFIVSKDFDFLMMLMKKNDCCFILDREGLFEKENHMSNPYGESYFKWIISFPLGFGDSLHRRDSYFYLETRSVLSNYLNYQKNESRQSTEESATQFPKGSLWHDCEYSYKTILEYPFFKKNVRSRLNRFDKGSMRYNNLINARMLYFQKICRRELKSTTEDFQAFLYYKSYRNSLHRKYQELYFNEEDDWIYTGTLGDNWMFTNKPNVPTFIEWINDNSLDIDVKKSSFKVAQFENFNLKVGSKDILNEFPLSAEKIKKILGKHW